MIRVKEGGTPPILHDAFAIVVLSFKALPHLTGLEFCVTSKTYSLLGQVVMRQDPMHIKFYLTVGGFSTARCFTV